jgi:hypothetical protein
VEGVTPNNVCRLSEPHEVWHSSLFRNVFLYILFSNCAEVFLAQSRVRHFVFVKQLRREESQSSEIYKTTPAILL